MPELQRPEISVLWGKAKHVDCASKTATYTKGEGLEEETIKYDYLINASGLRRVWPVVPRAVLKDGYLKEVGEYIEEVKNAKYAVVVVGGGMLS